MGERDPYAICRYVKHYRSKNGFSPRQTEVGCDRDVFALLVANGVLELLPSYEGGPKIYISLTEKGQRMAERRR